MAGMLCPEVLCSDEIQGKHLLLRHIRKHHLSCRNFVCKVGNCRKRALSYHGYRIHHYRYHSKDTVTVSDVRYRSTDTDLSVDIERDQEGGDLTVHLADTEASKSAVFESEFVSFVLKIKEKYTLPHSISSDIIDSTVDLFHCYDAMFVETSHVSSGIEKIDQLWEKLGHKKSFEKVCLGLGLVQPVAVMMVMYTIIFPS